MHGLNPTQRSAVKHTHSPLLVLAGAGSGKTRVITTKIHYLIEHLQYRPEHVFAVTFTNKAAREMRERTAKQLGSTLAAQLKVSTFHTLGMRFVHEEAALAGLTRDLSILDSADTLAVIKAVRSEQGGAALSDDEALRNVISRWKNNLVMPAQALSGALDDYEQWAAVLYERYNALLRAYNAVDFDDLIALPVRLLQEHAAVRERWQNRVRHLLVDEYQDTNSAQYELVRALIGPQARLTAVGDDDQSIYAWRGARPDNLNALQTDYPSLTVIKLEQNYRSTQRILHCANTLIANNPHLFDKTLWSEVGPGDPLRIVACKDGTDEADWVASSILMDKLQHQRQFAHYAILYRGNFQSRVFEQALQAKRIPYRLTGSRSFFERAEIKDVLAYLQLLSNPKDDTAFLRIVNVPRREIGATTLEHLAHYARQRECSLLEASDSMGISASLTPRALQRLRGFAQWSARWRDNVTLSASLVDSIQALLEDIDYISWLREVSSDARAGERRWQYVQELLDWMRRLETDADKPVRSLSQLLQHFRLVDMLDRQDDDSSRDEVQLMTLHAAKGLEFPQVFLVGCEEGLLPHQNAIEEDNIEEERRLAYVGITRGQRNVTCTYAKRRFRYGETQRTTPSRFLDELPEQALQRLDEHTTLDPEATLQSGKAALASMRALLDQ